MCVCVTVCVVVQGLRGLDVSWTSQISGRRSTDPLWVRETEEFPTVDHCGWSPGVNTQRLHGIYAYIVVSGVNVGIYIAYMECLGYTPT